MTKSGIPAPRQSKSCQGKRRVIEREWRGVRRVPIRFRPRAESSLNDFHRSQLAGVGHFLNLERGMANTKLLLQCLADALGERVISASRRPNEVGRQRGFRRAKSLIRKLLNNTNHL